MKQFIDPFCPCLFKVPCKNKTEHAIEFPAVQHKPFFLRHYNTAKLSYVVLQHYWKKFSNDINKQ